MTLFNESDRALLWTFLLVLTLGSFLTLAVDLAYLRTFKRFTGMIVVTAALTLLTFLAHRRWFGK